MGGVTNGPTWNNHLGVDNLSGLVSSDGMKSNNYPTHSMEVRRANGSVFTDWGKFSTDSEAIASATSRKLAKGLSVVRVIRAGSVIWSA